MRLLLGLMATSLLIPVSVIAEERSEFLEPIIVRAQHRDEALKDVPVSINVFSGLEIEDRSMVRIEDAFKAASNVSLHGDRGNYGSSRITIRGVSSTAFGSDPAVGFYIDGVASGSDANFNGPLFDIEQIEILKGPQGTLYGRNALSGAVNIRSVRPDLDGGFYTSLETIYGNRNRFTVRSITNAAVTDKSAFRLSAQGNWAEGWVKNKQGGPDRRNMDDRSVRMQYLLQATDGFEILLSGDYSEDTSIPLAHGEFNKVYDEGIDHALPYDTENKTFGGKAHLTYDLDFATIENIAAYRGSLSPGDGGDLSASPLRSAGFDRDYGQFTNEFRIASNNDQALDWTFGAFLMTSNDDRIEKTGLNMTLPAGALGPGAPAIPAGYNEQTKAEIDSRSAAIFGDATWHATSDFDVFGGARVSYDQRSVKYAHTTSIAGFHVYAPVQTIDKKIENVDVSPRIGIGYNLTDEIRTYASIAKGYKSGGFNVAFAQNDKITYDPEIAWNYEIGIKGSAFDNRLDFSGAAFYFDWKNQQIQAWRETNFIIHNAKKSRSFGFEAETTVRPVDGLELAASVGYLDAEFVDLKNYEPGVHLDGKKLPFSSKWSANLSASYAIPVTDAIDANIRVDYDWRSSYFMDPKNELKQRAYGLLNARLGIEGNDWSAHVFGRNLLDTDHHFGGGPTINGPRGTPGEPRTFGLGLQKTF